MNPQTLKFVKLDERAVIPTRGTAESAGLDLTAITKEFVREYDAYVYGTGLAIVLPPGYEAQIRPRSSIRKYGLALANAPGTIDSDYRGELIITMRRIDTLYAPIMQYKVGDKVAQLIIQRVELWQPEELSLEEFESFKNTERGEGGFGSTGL